MSHIATAARPPAPPAPPMRSTRLTTRLSGFAVIGALAFVVQMAMFNLLISVPVRPMVSNLVAVAASIMVAYLGNRRLTYRDRRSARAATEMLRFVAVNLFAFAVGELVLACSYVFATRPDRLMINSFTVLGVAAGTALRFWAYPRFVFATSRPSAS